MTLHITNKNSLNKSFMMGSTDSDFPASSEDTVKLKTSYKTERKKGKRTDGEIRLLRVPKLLLLISFFTTLTFPPQKNKSKNVFRHVDGFTHHTSSRAFVYKTASDFSIAPFRPSRMPLQSSPSYTTTATITTADDQNQQHAQTVLSGINKLYPPAELDSRMSTSRRDGYWPYFQNGDDGDGGPPKELIYGEFDVKFFGTLIERAWVKWCSPKTHAAAAAAAASSIDVPPSPPQTGNTYTFPAPYQPGLPVSSPSSPLSSVQPEEVSASGSACWKDKVFIDMGSGTGRLVLSAAAFFPHMSKCKGVEVLNGIHQVAVENVQKCQTAQSINDAGNDKNKVYEGCLLNCPQPTDSSERSLPMAPIQLSCGSFEDPYEYIGDGNIIFVFSSCMDGDMMHSLGKAFGRQCKPGTIIITTEYTLTLEGMIDPIVDDPSMPHGRFELEILEKVDGFNDATGGSSTAFIHRVVESLWTEGVGQREKPTIV